MDPALGNDGELGLAVPAEQNEPSYAVSVLKYVLLAVQQLPFIGVLFKREAWQVAVVPQYCHEQVQEVVDPALGNDGELGLAVPAEQNEPSYAVSVLKYVLLAVQQLPFIAL